MYKEPTSPETPRIEPDKKADNPKLEKLQSEKEKKMKKEKMIQKFGKEIEKLDGFVDYLVAKEELKESNLTETIVLAKVVDNEVGVFVIIEDHLSARSGIVNSRDSILGVYRNGQSITRSLPFRFSTTRMSNTDCLQEVNVYDIRPDKVCVKTNSPEGVACYSRFNITAKEETKKE